MQRLLARLLLFGERLELFLLRSEFDAPRAAFPASAATRIAVAAIPPSLAAAVAGAVVSRSARTAIFFIAVAAISSISSVASIAAISSVAASLLQILRVDRAKTDAPALYVDVDDPDLDLFARGNKLPRVY